MENTHFEVNYQTGEILFKLNFTPYDFSASFEFDVEVRFESDELKVQRDKFGNFIIKNLTLIEVL